MSRHCDEEHFLSSEAISAKYIFTISHIFIGSPYRLRVSPASLVSIQGPGISHGIYNVHSEYDFHLNTARAGPGSVKIRVGGPTGEYWIQFVPLVCGKFSI